ncbi:MAG TPA: hypothetical protein PKI71_16290, partial [Candidatus Rifleibacterium sp.]|nr:hypothetical protein [Candidatus Rifleibacterium sp.]
AHPGEPVDHALRLALAHEPVFDEVGLERARHGGAKQLDRMESETLDFHRKVLAGYDLVASEESERFVVVEADGEPEKIADRIVAEISRRFEELS